MRKRIYVVDDDEAMRMLLEGFLMDEGFRVVVGTTDDDVLATVLQERPDLLLLDIGWPKITMQNLIRVHAAAPALPIVAMMVSTSPGVAHQALDLGARECIEKPFELTDELLPAIHRALDRSTD